MDASDLIRYHQLPRCHLTGEYFTPVAFARKALAYLEKVIGPKWWTKNYRLWDMAAGTGNLEWLLPVDAYKSVYLSTLLPEDVPHCKRAFPGATVFQYDYLNDDIEHVFPQTPGARLLLMINSSEGVVRFA